ncbi:unnamed protein product [Trichogramma brassicae]|uniref:Uncharacterized protein n=1 Tax=Trichogramma brassicae TaxID=86971 RepID=A0A6H5I2X1_9HYME|nr:unnamed protein product [Trichogramma brassicae]
MDSLTRSIKNDNYCFFVIPVGDSTIGMARDRFKGALRELLHHSDEHNSSADSSDDTPMPEFKTTPKKM